MENKEWDFVLGELEEAVTRLEAQMEMGELSVKTETEMDPSGYDLESMLLLFDPSTMNAQSVLDAAMKVETEKAKAKAEEEAAAKRAEAQAAAAAAQQASGGTDPDDPAQYKNGNSPKQTVTEPKIEVVYTVDAKVVSEDVSRAILNLQVAYEDVISAQDKYVDSYDSAMEIQDRYLMNSADKSELYNARCEINDNACAVYSAIAEFNRQAMELNEMSGGWVSQQYNWYRSVYKS